ncbi:AsmA family protein [Bartonella ancashensis]|uniref:AsmA family protein n=1 Tax=Bartonella ancashensis TaxID=1318743 RepID=UPI0039E395C5
MRAGVVKFVSGIFFVVIFFVGTFAVIFPYIASTDAIRIRLAKDLSAWVGYDVQLSDPLRLSLFPYPKVLLSGITITSQGDGVVSLMDIESIEVDLSFVNLFRGRISLSEIRIVRPQFVMEKPIKKVTYFFETLAQSQGTLGLTVRNVREMIGKDPDRQDISHLLDQPFGRIVIEGGTLTYRDNVSKVTEKLTGLNATLDWPNLMRAARFRASASWRGELTELSMDSDKALLLLAGGRSSLRVRVNSPHGSVTFRGQAQLSEYYIFDGNVSIYSPDLNRTLSWIGSNHILEGYRFRVPVVWESRFLAQPTSVQMNNITFAIGTINSRGSLEFDFQKHKPYIIGSLAFDNLDLSILGSTLSIGEMDKFFDVTIFDRIGLDVRFSAPQANVGGIMLADLAAAMQIKNGRGIFDLGNASVFGGAVQSNIQITPKGRRMHVEGRISGTSIDMQNIAVALNLPSFVQAKTDFIMTARMVGNNLPELLAKMQGDLILNVSTGRLLGYNLDDVQKDLLNNEQFSLVKNDAVSTIFNHSDIKVAFSNGGITAAELSVHTTDWSLHIRNPVISTMKNKQVEWRLQARFQYNDSLSVPCEGTQCSVNNPVQSTVFFLEPSESILGDFFIEKKKTKMH